MNSANLIERKRPPVLLGSGCDGAARFLEMSGKISDINEIGTGGKGSAGDDILELADIPRPVVLEQRDLRTTAEPLERLGIGLAVFFEEVLDQDGNVFRSLLQARDTNLDCIEPVEEILVEAA
jgi:hypothetical protein